MARDKFCISQRRAFLNELLVKILQKLFLYGGGAGVLHKWNVRISIFPRILFTIKLKLPGAVHWRCSVKKLLVKISQENNCVGVSF